ncbi:MAG: hypothetical protein PHP57_13440 [Sideroxydans sp.]|nr:hypothetical protein [Sideroxydans sp.]
MIVDDLLKVSAAQAVTASAVSTNTIDLSQNRDIGEGEGLFVNFTVDTAATAAGAATVEFQIIASAAAALTTPTVIGSSGAIPKASLVAGALFPVRINPQVASLGLRYLGANYVVTTGPLTAGAFTATVSKDLQDGRKNYPSGFSVV